MANTGFLSTKGGGKRKGRCLRRRRSWGQKTIVQVWGPREITEVEGRKDEENRGRGKEAQ